MPVERWALSPSPGPPSVSPGHRPSTVRIPRVANLLANFEPLNDVPAGFANGPYQSIILQFQLSIPRSIPSRLGMTPGIEQPEFARPLISWFVAMPVNDEISATFPTEHREFGVTASDRMDERDGATLELNGSSPGKSGLNLAIVDIPMDRLQIGCSGFKRIEDGSGYEIPCVNDHLRVLYCLSRPSN